jgi:hypothetical protein
MEGQSSKTLSNNTTNTALWPSSSLSSGIFSGNHVDVVERVFQHNLWLDDENLQLVVRRYAGRELTAEER